MKTRLIALFAAAFIVTAQAMATPNNHTDILTTDVGIEKVVPITPSHATIEVADLNAALFATPVAVLVDVRPQSATTKVIAFSATSVHWKVAYRAPVVETRLAYAASPPIAPLRPDNPALAVFVQSMVRPAWHMPADYDPAIEVATHRSLI